jgi:hypothetical protein
MKSHCHASWAFLVLLQGRCRCGFINQPNCSGSKSTATSRGHRDRRQESNPRHNPSKLPTELMSVSINHSPPRSRSNICCTPPTDVAIPVGNGKVTAHLMVLVTAEVLLAQWQELHCSAGSGQNSAHTERVVRFAVGDEALDGIHVCKEIRSSIQFACPSP